MNFRNQKSKLTSNKILIIVLSVLLAASISVLIFFLVSNKKSDDKNMTPSNTQEVSKPNESSESGGVEKNGIISNATEKKGSDGEETITLTQDYSSWNASCSDELVLVNANNKIPESYNVVERSYCGVKINSIISIPLKKMIADARNQKGLNLWLSSSFRDIETQTRLYQDEVEEKLGQGYPQQKAEQLAAQEVARPGYSEHNTGLAVDFNGVSDNFKETEEYKWLLENSYKYGFVLRYPEEKKNLTGIVYEPWHFRYVGVDVATYMKEHDICFEEYVLLNS